MLVFVWVVVSSGNVVIVVISSNRKLISVLLSEWLVRWLFVMLLIEKLMLISISIVVMKLGVVFVRCLSVGVMYV